MLDFACIGTISQIEAFAVKSLSLSGYGERASDRIEILGNDAVIVAIQLAMGCRTGRMLAINPTSEDIERVKHAGCGRLEVVGVGSIEGKTTKTICLQAETGKRYWLFSRDVAPPQSIQPSPARIVYVDLYKELTAVLIAHFREHAQAYEGAQLFVNLSDDHALAGSVKFLKPAYVQASLEGFTGSREDRCAAAESLRTASGATTAILTAGQAGVLAVTDKDLFEAHPSEIVPGMGLGAGAEISALVVESVLAGEHIGIALPKATQRVEAFLRSQHQREV